VAEVRAVQLTPVAVAVVVVPLLATLIRVIVQTVADSAEPAGAVPQ
jgi:hypothetical protein